MYIHIVYTSDVLRSRGAPSTIFAGHSRPVRKRVAQRALEGEDQIAHLASALQQSAQPIEFMRIHGRTLQAPDPMGHNKLSENFSIRLIQGSNDSHPVTPV